MFQETQSGLPCCSDQFFEGLASLTSTFRVSGKGYFWFSEMSNQEGGREEKKKGGVGDNSCRLDSKKDFSPKCEHSSA